MDYSVPPSFAVTTFKQATEEQLLAALEVMHIVARADGAVSANELRHFLKFAKAVSDGRISAGELGDLVTEWNERQVADVRQRLEELSETLGSDACRRAAYELATKVATADGNLQSAEMSILESVEDALGIEP